MAEHPDRNSSVKQKYQVEFVDESSVAGDFFEPAAIGYVVIGPVANLPPDVDTARIYWLGREFEGVAGAPTLLLRTEGVGWPPARSGLGLTATYQVKGGEPNDPAIDLREFPTKSWESFNFESQVFPDRPEAQREDIALPDGRAILFRALYPPDRYMAFAYFDATVIFVVAAEGSPYNNRDAMLAVIKGLRAFE